jgi:hypothetical protein
MESEFGMFYFRWLTRFLNINPKMLERTNKKIHQGVFSI